ncbi:MAG TPA: dihydrodipicolinate reductase C-terminal domain-containing protein, partial [Candidatus Sulfotelmatobacter sp.]|nr:dihydrodipicolinate reductase C-terminal domain-containing protein [Candidatus Sulfotelmatobacter sp.]
ILCPNTNLLMLKFMSMLSTSGHLFRPYAIHITESHQAGKTSTPGTAIALAQSLGRAAKDIVSIRDPQEQSASLQIPKEHLARHAFHRITIQDGGCSLSMETRVYGASPYAAGVAQIIAATQARELEGRTYAISEFIEKGWI